MDNEFCRSNDVFKATVKIFAKMLLTLPSITGLFLMAISIGYEATLCSKVMAPGRYRRSCLNSYWLSVAESVKTHGNLERYLYIKVDDSGTEYVKMRYNETITKVKKEPTLKS